MELRDNIVLDASEVNQSNLDLSVYEQRWQALSQLMTQMESRFAQLDEEKFPRRDTLLNLLYALHAFGDKQFHFFYNGFAREAPFGLGRSHIYPPQCVLTATLRQIQNDLEVIERAAEQRIAGTDLEKQKLAAADRLAWLAIQPALSTLVKGTQTALTYFQKATTIRVLPYADVALISIPYTSTSLPRDLLAIPHEVGHFVFWHRQAAGPITDLSTNDYREWWEEIFADVYGASIAGPVIGFDFAELSLEYSAEDFDRNDHDHPNPSVRPLIYAKALKACGAQNGWGEAADQLAKQWQERCAERARKLSETPGTNRQAAQPKIENAQSPSELLEQLVNAGKEGLDQLANLPLELLQQLAALVNPENSPAQDLGQGTALDPAKPIDQLIGDAIQELGGVKSDWTGDLASFQSDQLDNCFADQVKKLLAGSPEKLSELNSKAASVHEWEEWVKQFVPSGDISALETKSLPAGTSEDLDHKPDGSWIFVFNAQGWTTEGPEVQPPK